MKMHEVLLQRKCACGKAVAEGEKCDDCEKKLRRKQSNASRTSEVPSIVNEVLASPGQPMDASTRAFMEPRFGHDFSRVRIHNDARAAQSARAVNALAYTVGANVVFAAGQYEPRTPWGQHLIAHELTHVLQQGAELKARAIVLGGSFDRFEQEAQSQSSEVMAAPNGTGQRVSVTATEGSGTLQRVNPGVVAAGVVGVAAGGYLLWAANCLSPLGQPMIENTRDVFLPWYYANSGDKPVPARVWDAFGHCWIGCAGTKKCGATATAIAGKSREFYREFIGGGPHNSYQQDTKNQTLGRGFGDRELDCLVACRDASVASSGGLDLGAPEAEYWTPTRGFYTPP